MISLAAEARFSQPFSFLFCINSSEVSQTDKVTAVGHKEGSELHSPVDLE